MSVGSIGVQVITPQTGTSASSRPQQQANDREDRVKPIESTQASVPAPSGTGKFVDKTA